jgi:PEGA domain-containing protein
VPLPLIVDDDWEPPLRPSRLPAYLRACGALLVIGGVAMALIRVTDWKQSAARVGHDAPDLGATPMLPASTNHTVWYPPAADETSPPHVESPRSPPSPRRLTVARRLTPSLPGYFAVNSMPWAVLSVDGRVVGNTPQLRIRVTPGRHRLVLARDGFETQTRWVTVRSGATVRITDIALRRVAP